MENAILQKNCSGCDNCLSESEKIDYTIIAQKILSCVFRVGQRFGVKHIIDVLRGSRAKAILDRHHDQLSTFGIMKEHSEHDLRYYINMLIESGYLKRTDGEYPIVEWTESSKEVINGSTKVLMRKQTVQRAAKSSHELTYDRALFSELSALRRKLALEANVPAFVIFGDRPMMEMSISYPTTPETMLSINGVGPIKFEKYGIAFLDVIKEYCSKNCVVPNKTSSIDFKATRTNQDRLKSSDETLTLYLKGYNIQEIAEKRQLHKGTILEHLAEQIQNGIDIDITSVISDENREKISKAIAILGCEKLAPLKRALPDEISYDEIRLMTAFYRR